MSKIALLFLTYSDIMHQERPEMKEYLDQTNVYIHSKNPDPSDMRTIPIQVPTEWGGDSIVIATLALLKTAFANADNAWFVLCSGDMFCIQPFSVFSSYLLSHASTSMFSDMTSEKASEKVGGLSKTQQWWAMTRADAQILLQGMKLDGDNSSLKQSTTFISHVKKQPVFADISKKTKKMGVMDETFFVTAMRAFYATPYVYTNVAICYTKWFSWVSKHPTIFNHVMPSDATAIATNPAFFFIRKTFPTFDKTPIIPKSKCVIIVIGTDNLYISSYADFLSRFGASHDIFIVLMTDDMNKVSDDLQRACCQGYYTVWNMVGKACDELTAVLKESYQTVTVIPEKVNANSPTAFEDSLSMSMSNISSITTYDKSESKSDVSDKSDNSVSVVDKKIREKRLPSVHDALADYFELKQTYQLSITRQRMRALAGKMERSNKEKRAIGAKLVPKCVNCNRPGGTAFKVNYHAETEHSHAHREYSAMCLVTPVPCALRIQIMVGNYEKKNDVISRIQANMVDIRKKIVNDKNQQLFGLLSSQNAIAQFDQLQTELKEYDALHDQYILMNKKKESAKYDELMMQQAEAVHTIKECLNNDADDALIRDAVTIYLNTMVPILNKLRAVRFNELENQEYAKMRVLCLKQSKKWDTCYLQQDEQSIEDQLYSGFVDNVGAFDLQSDANKSTLKKRLPLMNKIQFETSSK